MSGPRGLVALIFSCCCGVAAGLLLERAHASPWWLLAFGAVSCVVNGAAALLDARAGWHLWRRTRQGRAA